jgi:hypothetical protein
MPDGSTTAHIYRPKIATVLAEGYDLDCFRKDMLAALTVAIVALPLSMAIAVASGVSPERGLYAAVIGGFLVSALGGSRYQIGGPAGAFIVLVAATVTKFGLDELLLAVFLSGFMLTLIGLLRLASLIRYIPHADRRLHLRDCRHDLCQPAQGSRRPEIARCRTWTAVAQARDARSGVADPQSGRVRRWRGLRRLDLLAETLAAELAGNVDRRRACLGSRLAVPFAGRDHRQPFWPTPG